MTQFYSCRSQNGGGIKVTHILNAVGALCIQGDSLQAQVVSQAGRDAFASQSLQTLYVVTFLYLALLCSGDLSSRYERASFNRRHTFGRIVLAANALWSS